MFNVADYFKKFSKIEEREVSQRDAIRVALFETCGIDKVDFDVRKGVIVLKSHSIIKSMVYMKKKEVLEHLSRTSPQSKITDIR